MQSFKWGYIYLLTASFLWGSSFIAGKYAFRGFDPVAATVLRFIIACLFVFPRFLTHRRALIQKKNFLSLSLIAILMIPTTFLLQFIGLSYTSASSAAIIIGFEPLVVNIIGYFFFKERVERKNIWAGIFALVGIAIIIGFPSGVNYWGCFLVFLSTIVVAVWIKLSKNLMNRIPSNVFTPMIIVLGTLYLLPFLYFSEMNTASFNVQSIGAIIYLGIGCSWLANKFWNMGLEKVDSNKSGLFLALEPIFGVILGVSLLGEPLSVSIIIGSLLVVIPIISITLQDFRKKERSRPST